LTGFWDLGIFSQIMYNTINGKIMWSDFLNKNLLGEHFSPILFLCVPFYYSWQTPKCLLVIQSIFLSFSAIPVYLLAKEILKNNFAGFIFSIIYLFYPFIERINLYDFHEIALFPFFGFFTLYFYYKKFFKLYFLFIIISFTIKEEVCFFYSCGAYHN
jgi:uncharacterized membrane protein